ncbi:hypothetical protein TNCV_4063281 [Trichonephila clavipes]|nr:hypothetical protein TNCV_4063281 [Trichonephila clavipes]
MSNCYARTGEMGVLRHGSAGLIYFWIWPQQYVWCRGCLVVKVTDSWLARHEFEPSTTEDPACPVISPHFPQSVDGKFMADNHVVGGDHVMLASQLGRTRYRTLNYNKTTMYYSIDMNFFYWKDNLVALHFKYDQARRRFVEWAQYEIAVVPDFHKRILFSDEAHFWLNGYVNKQHCRIWSEANPQVYVETPLHPEN